MYKNRNHDQAPEKTYSRMFFGTLKTQVHIQGSRCRMLWRVQFVAKKFNDQ